MNTPPLHLWLALLLTAISGHGVAPRLQAADKDARGPGSGESPARQEFVSFTIITDRNIFNSNRTRPGRAGTGEEAKPSRVDTFTLVGTMTYEKGFYAFFDGSSSEFRKVLEPGKTIADYRVASVSGNGVRLEAATNSVDLKVGMQMKREEEGEWKVAGGSSASSAGSTSSSTTEKNSTDSSGKEDDLVKRLMQQREQELK